MIVASPVEFHFNVEVGLFMLVHQKEEDGELQTEKSRVIAIKKYSQDIYGPEPEPGPDDYYRCRACEEEHLRECFSFFRPVLGSVAYLLYSLELPEGHGYHRSIQDTKTWTQEKNSLIGPEITWTNLGVEPWPLRGCFMMSKGELLVYEKFSQGEISVPPGGTLRLHPQLVIDCLPKRRENPVPGRPLVTTKKEGGGF